MLRFHDDDVEEFKRFSAQCMEIVRTQDTGALRYDTYFNDDETERIVVERFCNSDALIQHSENLAHLTDATVATGSVAGEPMRTVANLSTRRRSPRRNGGRSDGNGRDSFRSTSSFSSATARRKFRAEPA